MTTATIPTELLNLESYLRFRSSLIESDQNLLDEMVASSQQYHQALNESGHDFPYPITLLSMLLEGRREIQRLRDLVAGR